MTLAISTFIGQLAVAAVYALAGVGFVIVYRGTQVLNFAQGILALLGGYFFYSVSSTAGLNFWIALPLAFVCAGVFAGLLYLVFFRTLLGLEPLRLVMFTIALSTVLTAATTITYGTQTKFVNVPFTGVIHFADGVALSTIDLAIIVSSVALLTAFGLFLQKSQTGLAMRAAAGDAHLATLRGINVNKVSALTWAFAGGGAMLAGIAYGAQSGLGPGVGDVLGFAAFPAIVLGGIDSIAGALTGAFVLAEIQGFTTAYIGAAYSTVAGYLLLLAILVVRPVGLFGSREVSRL